MLLEHGLGVDGVHSGLVGALGEGLQRRFITLVCAAPPTRDTEMPALMAGRMPALNRSVSRKIWPSVMEMTLVGI